MPTHYNNPKDNLKDSLSVLDGCFLERESYDLFGLLFVGNDLIIRSVLAYRDPRGYSKAK